MADLAERLDDPSATADVLCTAPVPVLQVAEALQALGGAAPREGLTAFLDTSEAPGTAAAAAARGVAEALAWLAERCAVRDGAGGRLLASPALADCLPAPLGLGAPAATLLASAPVRTLRAALTALGRPAPSTRAEALAALVAHLGDADAVRAVVDSAAGPTARWLHRLARHRSGTALAAPGSARAHTEERAALTWAAARALVVVAEWGYGAQMPAEVALALRGPDHRAPFTPQRPAVPTAPVRTDDVARESAAALGAFTEQATAVLDDVARRPPGALKSGGVGARELTRLGKLTGAGDAAVRLVLETAAEAGLLEPTAAGVGASADLGRWRATGPGPRCAELLTAWWRLGVVPTLAREEGRALPTLLAGPPCPGCRGARQALLRTAAQLPDDEATDLPGITAAAHWAQPVVHAVADPGGQPYAHPWAEAELLGVLARGALSPLGRALVAGDRPALEELAGRALPPTSSTVILGSDLTAVAPGSPSAALTALLDSCADREGRGGAVVWRLSPGSVRRALDGGASGEELERALGEVATSGLPQPLTYLVRDVARRHGSLRVRAAAAVVRSDDTALLAQAAADRSLRRLGLALLAPTALTSTAGQEETVAALRAAGYLPVAEGADGAVLTTGRPPVPDAGGGRRARRAASGPRGEQPASAPADLDALAAALLTGGAPPAGPATGSEAVVRQFAPDLPLAQVRLLAHAVDAGEDVVLEYVSSTGRCTERQISELVLVGSALWARDVARDDDRTFTVARIAGVHPVR